MGQPHSQHNPFHTWHLQTEFLRSRPHERISSDCFRKFVVYLLPHSHNGKTYSMTACFQWCGLFFSPSSILWEKMKEEPNYCRIKLLYVKDTLLWLWTLIPLENTPTIILIYHAGSDDATHWMKGCKIIIIYVCTHTPICLVRKWKECYNSC